MLHPVAGLRRVLKRTSGIGALAVFALAVTGPIAHGATLNLIHCWGEQRTQWVDEMVAEFAKAHPGVTINTRLVGCGSTLGSTYVKQFLGGAPPDVVMLHSLDIPGISELNGLLPLDAFIKQDHIPMSTWYPSEIASSQWESKIYGLPIRTGGDANSLLYYNTDLFASAGLDPNKPPATWDDLAPITQKLIRYDSAGQLVQAALPLNGGDYSQLAWLATGGARLLSPDGRDIEFGQPEAIDAATFALDLYARQYSGGMGELNAFLSQHGGMRGAFNQGLLAMQYNGSWEYNYIKTANPNLNIHMAVRPPKTADGFVGMHAGTYHYAISSLTPYPDLAWQLVKWLTIREESAGAFMFRQGRPSPVPAFNQNPGYTRANPDWYVIGDALSRVQPLPIYPFTRDIVSVFSKAFDKAASGDGAPAAVLQEAAQQAQAIVDDYWSKAQR